MKDFGYKFFKFLLKPIYLFYYNPKIYNKEVLKNLDGPVVFAANHIHVMDQNNAIISTKRVIHYMAKKEYFDGKLAWFFKATGCISVNRSIKDTTSVSQALKILKSGGCIGLFPEGTRNRTENKLMPFKYGAVAMAKKTNATIVPYAVVGTYKFRSKNLKIKFGKPFKVTGEVEETNEKLYNIISDLIDELNNL